MLDPQQRDHARTIELREIILSCTRIQRGAALELGSIVSAGNEALHELEHELQKLNTTLTAWIERERARPDRIVAFSNWPLIE